MSLSTYLRMDAKVFEMADVNVEYKFQYKIFEIRIPGNVYIKPKINVLGETDPEIMGKHFGCQPF